MRNDFVFVASSGSTVGYGFRKLSGRWEIHGEIKLLIDGNIRKKLNFEAKICNCAF